MGVLGHLKWVDDNPSVPLMPSLYPQDWLHGEVLARTDMLSIFTDAKVGRGLQTKKALRQGQVISAFTGQQLNHVQQLTLQVSPTSHIYDPYFIGLLTHSCAPNCILDMAHMELLALRDIPAGSILTIDYATTEDSLFKQFPCSCGSANCRHWITGRREEINEEGRAFLAPFSKLA